MLKNIKLGSLSPFSAEEKIENLSKINFLYAPNGSGKTSISNLLKSNNSNIEWENDEILPTQVFNRDYLRKAFMSPDGEPGIFRLGEDVESIGEEIKLLEKDIDGLKKSINGKEKAISSKEADKSEEYVSFRDFVWEASRNIPKIIKDNVSGFGRKELCCEKTIGAIEKGKQVAQSGQANSGTIETIEELAKKAEVIYSEEREAIAIIENIPVPQIDFAKIAEMLNTPLISSSESEYSHKVKEKDNFDWVIEGIRYVKDDLICPFCFQNFPEYLKNEISNLIDKKYQESIDFLQMSKLEIESFINSVDVFIDEKSEIFEKFEQGELKICWNAVISKFRLMGSSLENKINQPSSRIEITWPSEIDIAQELVGKLNEMISSHNSLIESSSVLRRDFSDNVWKSFAKNSVEIRYNEYLEKVQRLESIINKIKSSACELGGKLTQKSSDLEVRKRSLLSSEAVAARINNLLLLCNFHSFKIKVSETESGGYFIIRNNGERADVETLSEGERNFITFLYFLQSLEDEGKGDVKRFVVIDDPISSLDSDVMFTVSMLIRDLIEKVYKGTHRNVDQILIMTHNTRFHNEICYRHNGGYPQEYHFYRIIKKSPDPNTVEFYGQVNSIRTSYQELWDQIAIASRDKSANHPWLANTMRRIIESYFSTLGGEFNLYEIDSDMSYEEQIVHNSLIAWSHSGSHTIMDYDAINLQSHSNEKWLNAFMVIFEKTGNISHYEVMMRNANQFIENII